MALAKQLCLKLVRSYQLFLSPLFPPSCRFHPSCSQYAIEAITIHGVPRGLTLTLRRLLRCHPFCRGGYDPVAPKPAMAGAGHPPTRNHSTN